MPPAPKTKPKKPPDYEVKLKLGKTTTTKLHHVDSIETNVPNQPPVVNFPANVGDVEVFEAEFLDAQGNVFSSEGGVWTRVRLPTVPDGSGVWHAVLVHKWPKGDLTVQLLQDFDDPPPYLFAITGGTGDYLGAYGQIEFVSPQDITFRFSTP